MTKKQLIWTFRLKYCNLLQYKKTMREKYYQEVVNKAIKNERESHKGLAEIMHKARMSMSTFNNTILVTNRMPRFQKQCNLRDHCEFPFFGILTMVPSVQSLGNVSQGNLLTCEQKQIQWWAEHFCEILNRPDRKNFPDIAPASDDVDVSTIPATQKEIIRLLKSLKSKNYPDKPRACS